MNKGIEESSGKKLLTAYLLNSSGDISPETGNYLSLLKHEKATTPLLFIDTSSFGLLSGADHTLSAIQQYLLTNNIEADIIETGCNGFTSAEPRLDIQLPGKAKISFSNVTFNKVDQILDGIFNNTIPYEYVAGQYHSHQSEAWEGVPFFEETPYFVRQKRNLMKNCGIISPSEISSSIANGGYKAFVKAIRNYSSERSIGIIEDSMLKGRGGEGFPVGAKWRLVYLSEGDRKYFICNAEESDPGAFMNRMLIESDPHLIIEGIALGAYATGCGTAYIYIRENYELAISRLENAIEQAKSYGLLGHDILDSGYSLNIHLFKTPGAFVCGEETALIKTIEGKRGMPVYKPPYPTTKGLFDRPTVVNNIETVCNIPGIILNGPAWYMQMGTDKDKGTKLISLSGKIINKGVAEIEMGKPLREVIYSIGDGVSEAGDLKAVLIGGPLGCCLPESELDTCIDFVSFADKGFNMGSCGIVVMDKHSCMVDTAKFHIGFLKKESCGKCIPCREGTRQIHEILEYITHGPGNETGHQTLQRFKGVMQLENISEVIRETSLCGLGRNAPNILQNTLKYFRPEFEEHIFDRKCGASACNHLRHFVIDPVKCTGCNACARKCPKGAIIGTKTNPHFIIEEKCTGCGICFDTCKFVAIYIK